MLFAPDLDEDLVQLKRVAESLMPAPQALGIFWLKLNAPEANRFVAYGDTPFRQQVFDISMAQIEAMERWNQTHRDWIVSISGSFTSGGSKSTLLRILRC